MRSHRRRRAGTLATALAILAALAPGAAEAAPVAAKRGVLTGDTTIRWRGTAGIRLATTGTGTLPEESMTLFVTGGTYAFVSMLVDPQPADCRVASPWRHCYGFNLSKFPGAELWPFQQEPGRGHFTNSVRPPNIIGRHLDVYLFTDGEATLRLRPRGYRGRSAYVAKGAVRGIARRLPGSCADVCGSTPVSEVAAGGAMFDYGSRPGHLATHVHSMTRRSTVPDNHAQLTHTCFYPNAGQPDVSPQPADHPHGCDVVPAQPGDADKSVIGVLNAGGFQAGSYKSWNVPDRTGKVYAGFYAGQAWIEDGYNEGYGVWFNYGIR